ncbi:MAG: M14 family metallopeptidase [Saprospiraceae bacterium]|nr:M14 family metallopeptidase [Saprospiraceae bacterium]
MKIVLFVSLLSTILGASISAQPGPPDFFNLHREYQEPSITTKKFKLQDIEGLILKLSEDPRFEVKPVGKSFLGKPIYLVRIGKGNKKVLLWSQMHGDESTATMALLDIFNYLKRGGIENGLTPNLLEECSLYFIPMLNPDGAELFVRRNAQQIDINRDALFLQSPEARLLKSIRDSLQPDFGFNLHDQSKYYTAGDLKRPASISLLAPAYNVEKEINAIRARAMLLIAKMQLALQSVIPNGVGRYDDEFEPRAFGDNIQKWGTSTILIETGAYDNDPEKQFLRKVNFGAILMCLQAIADNSYYQNNISDYWSIPENKNRLNDLVIRNVVLTLNNMEYRSDISLNVAETTGKAYIADMGDLSVFKGYKEWDGTGKKMVAGKTYPVLLKNYKRLHKINQVELLRQGYTEVRLEETPPTEIRETNLLQILGPHENKNNALMLGFNPNALIYENGVVVACLMNGNVLPLKP